VGVSPHTPAPRLVGPPHAGASSAEEATTDGGCEAVPEHQPLNEGAAPAVKGHPDTACGGAPHVDTGPCPSADAVSQTTTTAQQSEQPTPRQPPVWCSLHPTCMWVVGFMSFAVGSTVNFFAFGFAAQSLLAALGSVQFITFVCFGLLRLCCVCVALRPVVLVWSGPYCGVWWSNDGFRLTTWVCLSRAHTHTHTHTHNSNVFFSVCLLKEPATSRTAVATVAIVVGNVVLVLCGNHESHEYTAVQLCDMYLAPPYVTFIALCIAAVTVLTLRLPRLFRQRRETLEVLASTLPGAPVHVPTSVAVDLPLSYALQGAIIGTQSVTFAKSTSELLRITLSGDSQLHNPATYIILVLWIATMIFWIHRMNVALKLFPAQFIVPVLQVLWTVLSMIGGTWPMLTNGRHVWSVMHAWIHM